MDKTEADRRAQRCLAKGYHVMDYTRERIGPNWIICYSCHVWTDKEGINHMNDCDCGRFCFPKMCSKKKIV